MSTYFLINSATLATCPDPDGYTDEGVPEIGRTLDGGIIRQGRGSGVFSWSVLTQSEYAELYTAWDLNKNGRALVTFPPTTGTTLTDWQSGHAALHEPLRGRIENGVLKGTTMRISEIGA